MSEDMTEAKCALCEKALGDERHELNGRKTCAGCRDAVLAEIASEDDAGVRLLPVVAVGVAASAACGAAWALLIVTTHSEIGFAAVGVGWAVGQAVLRAAGGKRGKRLQQVAVACSTLGLVLGKYFYVAHLVRSEAAALLLKGGPDAAGVIVPSWADPRLAFYFVQILPELIGIYDALWLFIALSSAWRALAPATVDQGHGRNSPPAA